MSKFNRTELVYTQVRSTYTYANAVFAKDTRWLVGKIAELYKRSSNLHFPKLCISIFFENYKAEYLTAVLIASFLYVIDHFTFVCLCVDTMHRTY